MLNNVVLVGRVVRQPELSQTIDGKKVSTITLAVTRSFKNALSGEYENRFYQYNPMGGYSLYNTIKTLYH